MNQFSSNEEFKQQHDVLVRQLVNCYRFDRYPIKKQLDAVNKMLRKRLHHQQVAQAVKAQDKTDRLALHQEKIFQALSKAEKMVQSSMAKREKRSQDLPVPEFQFSLPVAEKVSQIKAMLEQHQVIVVAGETGSGKTTQLPKIALLAGRGIFGQIAHTQPRRLAARSVANRIAQELKTPLGEKVGFKVRFSDRSREETYIKLMTDGILLAETQTDRYLNRYDTIIIDEAHERSLNIDFLLGYLKQLLPRRPDLKVIITSATIDTERFSQFFNQAPVIEVSGRTYPVEIRYRPNDEDADMTDGILAAVDELADEAMGDILVFLSGEREIRETAEALRKHHPSHTEIVPLYARLSPAEQGKIFSAHSGRRIVLATNVAETSLTVPGIRYVIDTGLARISRYSIRHKIQRLPVEKVSQASARQRSGRCGRVSDGIAIRLYSEEDHNQRPAFTDPEILRTNLAQVILQMLSLRLGDINAFPFLEAPSSRQINDGFLLLEQLGAINSDKQLTRIGRSLARLSVDPRIGRVIIAAQKHNVLSEVLVIAAALSCQDPRERPSEKQQAADEQHAKWASKRSDFISYLNLWIEFEAQRKHLSQRKLRQYCQKHFLSFMRMREWRELYQQLFTQTKELKFTYNDMNYQGKEDEEQLDYAAIHQSLLTGFLSNVGFKEDKNIYLGARNMRFAIFPGSGLYKRKPKWLMAAEIVETSSVYARTVAGIEPGWLEQEANHLLKHHYYDPFWEDKPGQVSAWSKVTLYGLTINPRKKVNYGPIDPEVAQEIFIRDALVSGEYREHQRRQPAFIQHNLQLIDDIEHLEHKSRRKDLLVDDLAIFEFYNYRIKQKNKPGYFIYSRASFEKWRNKIEKSEPEYLYLKESDLLQKDAEHISDKLYPPMIRSGDLQLPLEYHFLPGHPLDGVTVIIPLAVINQLDETIFDWLVPGFIREKITLLIRALPKTIRKQFVPVPETVTAFLESVSFGQGRLLNCLTEFLKSRLAYHMANQLDHEMQQMDQEEFQAKLPEHLSMRYKLIDADGNELDSTRNFDLLKQQWGERALNEIDETIEDSIERQGITEWDFESLPASIDIEKHGMKMVLYPALKDCGDSVAVKLFDQPGKADLHQAQGVYRLLRLQLAKELKQLIKQLPDSQKACLLYASTGDCNKLKDDMVTGLLLHTLEQILGTDEFPCRLLQAVRTQGQFQQLVSLLKTQLPAAAEEIMQTVITILQLNQSLQKALKGNIPFHLVNTIADIKNQQAGLIHPGFISETPVIWLKRMPRYIKAMQARIEKAKKDYRKDALSQSEITSLIKSCKTRRDQLLGDEFQPLILRLTRQEIVEFRWLIEELRVSLFAQELKTAQPVSVKRLEKKWQELYPGQ